VKAAEVTAAVLAAQPELELTGTAPELARVAAMPELAELRKVTFAGVREPGFCVFVASPHLRLQALTAYLSLIGVAGARALAAAPWATSLVELGLSQNPLGDEGVAALAASPFLRHLERLYLSSCNLTERAPLAPLLTNVKELALGENPGVIAMAPALERLALNSNGLTDEHARALAESRQLGNLRNLQLSKNAIGDRGAAALAASTGLGRLTGLDLRSNALTEAGAEALANGPGMPALKTVTLSENPFRSVEIEEWTDWDGSRVGRGPNVHQWADFRARYGRRFSIE
jgi:Leucine Rich repeat